MGGLIILEMGVGFGDGFCEVRRLVSRNNKNAKAQAIEKSVHFPFLLLFLLSELQFSHI